MDRRRGKGVSVPAFAFLCHVCGMDFKYIDELQIHEMTDHASESEKDNDVSNPNPPRSFVSNLAIGPPDGSFQAYDSNRIQRRLNEHLEMYEQKVVVPEIPRPLNPESSNFFGDFRGIPGCNNSCYLDVFFMILSFSSLFDGIYTQEALNSSVLLRIILFELVIPLRTRMSVSRDVIAMIRQLMSQKTRRVDYLGDIFDLEEFLMHLCQELNLSSICNFVNSSDIDGAIVCPLVLSIVSAGCKGVHTSLQDSILYTLNAKETSIIDLPTAFFARVRPGNFGLPPLVLPQTRVFLETGTYIGGRHVVDKLIRAIYTLSAIVCIRLSHYVLFLRLKDGEWFFFDSMRKIDSGHHVPTSTHIPYFQDYLESGCDESLLTLKSDASPGESRDSFHERVTNHAYAYFFTATREVSKESECVGLPAEEPLLDARRMWEASQQTAKAHLHVMQPRQFSSQSSSAGGAAAVSAKPAQSSRKPSAGGGAAAVPYQPPQSFGHITHQGVVEPQTWQQKLQSFFHDLFIFHLVKNIIYSSGEHASSDDEFKTNTILLSSISFYAQKMLENVSSAFMFSAPDITFDEFKTVHRIVTSFQIGAQAFRCTAVVFNDGHVVAFPELKNLQKGDPRREPQREAFYSAIESHFQENPGVVIDKMLLEPCV